MDKELFNTVIKEMESSGTANDRYFLAGIEDVELKTIQAVAEAYAAKLQQKQHLVELMKMDEFDELLSIAVEANNHARRIVNKELILVDDKPKHWDKINKRAEILSKYADKSAPKIVQSEVKQLSECFDLGEIRAKQITSSMRKLPLVEFVNYLNSKASRYATDRAKKSLEKAAENAKVEKVGNSGSWMDAGVKKSSITNLKNLEV